MDMRFLWLFLVSNRKLQNGRETLSPGLQGPGARLSDFQDGKVVVHTCGVHLMGGRDDGRGGILDVPGDRFAPPGDDQAAGAALRD